MEPKSLCSCNFELSNFLEVKNHTSKFQILPFDWSAGLPLKDGYNFLKNNLKQNIYFINSVAHWEISCDMFDIP